MRSYAYICSLGADGLKEASEVAVLNANYLKALMAEPGIAEYLPIAFDRTCMHEFVLSGQGAKDELGIRTLDIAKRMLDHNVHPPTVYFPLLVDEALMIEPTETETKERLDHFAEVVRSILEEAKEDPEVARTAPHTTPVRRLDEAGAAKRPVVRWRPTRRLGRRRGELEPGLLRQVREVVLLEPQVGEREQPPAHDERAVDRRGVVTGLVGGVADLADAGRPLHPEARARR